MSSPWNPAEADPRAHLVGLIRLARERTERSPTPALLGWLGALARLEPVSLEALLGEEDLPPESVRLIPVEAAFIEALQRGALAGNGVALPPSPAARLVVALRSERVARAPGLEICAWSDLAGTRPLAPMARRQPATDTLLLVFETVPARLEVSEFSLRFGLDASADPQDAPMRDPQRGLLDVSALARRLAGDGVPSGEAVARALRTPPDRRTLTPAIPSPEEDPP